VRTILMAHHQIAGVARKGGMRGESQRWRRGCAKQGAYARIWEVISGFMPRWMMQTEWDDGEVVDLEGGLCSVVAW
jgi:hypothetical protein